MIEDTEGLVSSLNLLEDGIFPQLRYSDIISDYPSLNASIKQIYKPCAFVRHVDAMVCLISYKLFKINVDATDSLDKESARKILFEIIDDLHGEVEEVLKLTVPREKLLDIFEAILDHMPWLSQPDIFLRIKHDIYNHIISSRQEVRDDLDRLLHRSLTAEEFHFIAASFLRYMAYAQDLEAKNKRVEVKVQESRNIILAKIDITEQSISISKDFIYNIESLDRHPDCDLNVEFSHVKHLEEQLAWYHKEKDKFDLSNGSQYSINAVKKYAYFAMIFCALSLGLRSPAKGKNPEGNPIVDFLRVVQGLENFTINHNSATCRVSRSYAQFNQTVKKDPKFKVYVPQLLEVIKKSPGCQDTWRAANNVFQSLLPRIITRPRFSFPSVGTTP